MSIYKACDIRGRAATELTPNLYRRWGHILGLQVDPQAKFVVGGDVRQSTPEYLAALAEGLSETGVDVVDLGVVSTPMIYYAKRRLTASGCAIVTASHNPADDNGLKWMIGERPPGEEDVAALERAASVPDGQPGDRTALKKRELDISFDYVAWLQETWVESMAAQCRVMLDPLHGCCASRARRYLQAVFPQSLFLAIHDTPDPAFAGRVPDCSRAENLDELAEAVYRERAHVGLAFDGDGDRIAVVDDDGNVLTAEEATSILLQSFDGDLEDRPFVHDVKFSDRVPQLARKLGAEPLVERSGHAFIRARMIETGAPFGAEVSGHYFFGELDGGDDGLFTACRLIAHLAASGKSLSELRRACPPVYITPDLRVPVEPSQQGAVLQRMREVWSEHPLSFTDGVRVDFPDGWALARGSVTEPVVTFRFESVDWPSLHHLVWEFCDGLGEIGEVVWEYFAMTVGHADPVDA